jgi:hypothetical protein
MCFRLETAFEIETEFQKRAFNGASIDQDQFFVNESQIAFFTNIWKTAKVHVY